MLNNADIIKLKGVFVTKQEFKSELIQFEKRIEQKFVTKKEFHQTITDLRDTMMEFLVAFREDFENFRDEMIEFRSEMRDITTYQQTRLDRLDEKSYS